MGGPGSGRPRHRVQQTGLLGAATWSERPARVHGTVQRGGDAMPMECPKCHSRWIETTYWEARCLCGARWYRLVGEVRPVPRGASRSYPTIKETRI